MPTDRIASTFARQFRRWKIELPADARTQQSGKLSQAGWNIEWIFGTEDDSEYLDYYATHHMTNDRHVRIHSNGRATSVGKGGASPANNRFSDNPFRRPDLTPEQVERIEARNRALRIYRETGDDGPAIELGLFPPKPEKEDETGEKKSSPTP